MDIPLGRGSPLGLITGRLDSITQLVHGSASPGVARGAVLLLGAIREQLSKAGTGRIYKIPIVKRTGELARTKGGKRRYRFHRASAPGQPPAPNWGDLRRSSVMGMVGGVMRVGVTATYGPYLERGTRRIRPRPFMAPALEQVRAAMIAEGVTVIRGPLYGR